MVDNVELDAGAGGAIAATDDIGGVHFQRVKVTWGADGTANDTSAANPLPVVQTGAISPGSAAANLGKAEDVAAANGDVGVAFLTKRQDTITGDTSTDGDYQHAKSDSVGRIYVAASAGTNLNTSALALEAGGNLAGAATSLSVMDDWDESDRAKVNPIVGQAGVAAGAGAVGATVQRVTHASDDPVTVSVQLIDDAIFAEDVAAQAADKGIAVLAVRRDADTSLVGADNDYANLQVNAAGSLKVAVTAGGVAGIAEDAASAGGEEGIMVLAVRRDAASSGVGADGDFAALSVTADGSLRVAGAGGGTQFAEDAAHTTADVGTVALVVRRDTAAVGSGTDGDYSTLNVNSVGRLYASATLDAALPAGTNNIGDVDVLTIAAGDNNIGNVDIVTMPNVTLAAGTNTNEVVGDVADDAATAGNPVLVGGVAVETDGTDPTTVSAEGDAAFLRTDRARRLLVSDVHPRFFNVSADYAAAQTNTSVQAAPGAGLKLYITDIEISNGAVAGNITLLDGSGGAVKLELYPAINGGIVTNRRTPIVLTANTALCITSTTVTTHSVNIGGYIAP